MNKLSTVDGSPLTHTVRQGHEEFIFPCCAPYYREPLVLVRGEGVFVEDADGREYLDGFSGILTTSLGHCHPEVVARIRDQLSTLGHTSTLYLSENQVEAARRLARLAPGQLTKCFFTNSGTEALETAIMAARMYTGRMEIVALRHAYHGRSHLATEVTAHSGWRPLASQIAGIRHARAPYCYRSEFVGRCDEEAAEAFARDIEEVIVTTTNGQPAALVAETILGVGGYVVPPPGYFQRAVEIIHKYGGLFICDEVQAGFGRTGDKWFGIEHWNVEPDIMFTAKGVANGFPVGVTIARPEIADAWRGKTISTFGGNPVAMAATAQTLDVMVRENVPARAATRGQQLRAGLEACFAEHEWIGEVRGMGLMQALELVTDRESKQPDAKRAKALLESAKEEGLLIGVAGLYGNVMRIAPSLLITEAEMADVVERLTRACRRVAREA